MDGAGFCAGTSKAHIILQKMMKPQKNRAGNDIKKPPMHLSAQGQGHLYFSGWCFSNMQLKAFSAPPGSLLCLSSLEGFLHLWASAKALSFFSLDMEDRPSLLTTVLQMFGHSCHLSLHGPCSRFTKTFQFWSSALVQPPHTVWPVTIPSPIGEKEGKLLKPSM